MIEKENSKISLDEFIKIVNDMKKHFGKRIQRIEMSDEFFNHLMLQMPQWAINNSMEVNNIVGVTINKYQNGKLIS